MADNQTADRRRYVLLVGVALALLVGAIGAFFAAQEEQSSSRKMTFAECEAMGGEPWRVDLFHPDICSACAEYRACEARYEAGDGDGSLAEACPQGEACAACRERSAPYPDICPDGDVKIGEITDAATWFQCCR